MKNILITGSIAYDYIMNFNDTFKNHILPEKIHVLSVSFVAEKLEKQFGGTAGNIAYNYSLLNEKAIIFATVGNDFKQYKEWLHSKNISTEYIQEFPDHLTASAHVITDEDDNQITAFHGGAMMKNNVSIAHIFEEKPISLLLVSPNASLGNMIYIQEAIDRNIPYILDPGQNTPLYSDAHLKKAVDSAMMLIVNDYELSLVEQKTGYSEEDLVKKLEYLIITYGKEGSTIFHNKKKYTIDIAKAATVTDPTGAGDAYRAGILKGLQHGLEVQEMGEIAATAAAYAIEKYGTQSHSYTILDFKTRFIDNFNKKLPENLFQ